MHFDRTPRLLVLFVLLTSLFGCSTPAPTGATTMIGPMGGTASGAGVTLEVPSGALTTSQSIAIAASSTSVPSGYEGFSPVYHFGPDGLTFASPVTVRIPFTGDASRATIFWTSDSGSGFTALPTTIVGTTATAQVTHFSEGFVGAAVCTPNCGGNGSTCQCTQTCGGHTTGVTCDGTRCQCTLDGTNTASFSQGGACAGQNTLAVPFATECGGAAPVDAGTPADAGGPTCTPTCGGSSSGCNCTETCGGHTTTLVCDATTCQCTIDGTRGASFSSTGVCAMGAGVGSVFTSMCGAAPAPDGGVDGGSDAGPTACSATTPSCGGSGTGCNCMATCNGHTYAMTCDATSCQCSTDGANTTSFVTGTSCAMANTSAAFTSHCEI